MDYIVELEFEGPGFVAVPNAVVDDTRLGADALAVLVYLARLSGGRGPRVVRVGAICSRFGFGKGKWQRIARELRAVGALADNFDGRTQDGRHIVRSLSVGWPKPVAAVRPARAKPCKPENPVQKAKTYEPENPPHRPKTCEPENTAHRAENAADLSRKTRLLKEEQTGGDAAAAPRSKAAASPPVRDVQKQPDTNRRAALAASLGLPVRHPVSGQWHRVQMQEAEN